MAIIWMTRTSVCLLVFVLSIPESRSRNIYPNGFRAHNNGTRNSTILGPVSHRFDGLIPVVITSAVLLQVFLPLLYCSFFRGFRICCMRKEQAKRKKRKKWGESIIDQNECCDPCCRLFSLHFYLSFFLWFTYLICYNVLDWSKHGVVFKNLHIMSIVVIVFSFLFVLLESFVSREKDHLEHPMQREDVNNYLKRLRDKRPVITMSVECYHNVEKQRTSGKGTTTKKVVTYTGTREFSYNSWEDMSSLEIPWISHSAVTRLKIDAFIDFGDKETEQEFQRQKDAYYNAFRYFDKEMAFHVKYEIPGMDNRILVFADYSQKDGWISEKYFWYATCCCLTWPYRWLFRAKTEKCRYDIRKKMYAGNGTGRTGFDRLAFLYGDNVPPPTGDGMKGVDTVPSLEKSSPSFIASQLPSDAMQAYLNANCSSDQTNLITNQEQPFRSIDVEGLGGPTHKEPTNLASQEQATAKQEAPHPPLLLQEEPDLPPPSYDVAIGPEKLI